MKKLFTAIFSMCLALLFGQTTLTFTNPSANGTATNTWPCPAGVTSVTVECWGGGGGGGGADAASVSQFRAGGGGGGGSYVKKTSITVVPGTTYTITVGAGGAGGSGGIGSGGVGGKSEFSGGVVTPVTASGGTPGNNGHSLRAAGIGGVLGGIYAAAIGSAGSGYAGSITANAASGGAQAGVLITSGAIASAYPSGAGSGYTSTTGPTITVVGATSGSGGTVTTTVNPNINSLSPTTVNLGVNGVTASAGANTRDAKTGTWALGSTTVTLSTALTSLTNLAVGNVITGAGIPAGTTLVAPIPTSTAAGQVLNLSAATTAAAATATAFTLFKGTATGGAGGAGGNGGAGGAAFTNSATQTGSAGANAVGIGGGGGGAVADGTALSGGAGAAGQVILTFTSLSVELANLEAKAQDKSTFITWTTASEKNNAQFNIEQSTDGKTFQTIGEVKGNGTTAAATKYSFEHTTPSVGVNYYRLKQVDYDGTETLSSVRSVVFGGKTFVVKQTVVKDVLDVVVGEEGTTPLSIFNLSGQQVMTIKAQGTQRLDVSTLPSGMYMIRTTTGDVSRFVKQ